MVSDFQDHYCSNLGNESNLAIDMKKHSTEAATERCSSNLHLAAIIKSDENNYKGIKISK